MGDVLAYRSREQIVSTEYAVLFIRHNDTGHCGIALPHRPGNAAGEHLVFWLDERLYFPCNKKNFTVIPHTDATMMSELRKLFFVRASVKGFGNPRDLYPILGVHHITEKGYELEIRSGGLLGESHWFPIGRFMLQDELQLD